MEAQNDNERIHINEFGDKEENLITSKEPDKTEVDSKETEAENEKEIVGLPVSETEDNIENKNGKLS